MSNNNDKEDSIGQRQVWERGWEDHRRCQSERLAALPLSEKLAWLEEAHRLVLHMKAGIRKALKPS